MTSSRLQQQQQQQQQPNRSISKRYPIELQKAIRDVQFIQNHMKRADEYDEVNITKMTWDGFIENVIIGLLHVPNYKVSGAEDTIKSFFGPLLRFRTAFYLVGIVIRGLHCCDAL